MSLAATKKLLAEKKKEAFRLMKSFPGSFSVTTLALRLHACESTVRPWYNEFMKKDKKNETTN